MSPLAPKPQKASSIRSLLARAWRSDSGATALEFGFIALPFFALLVAIFETGTMFIAQEVLQTATTRSARLIMTGQAQRTSMTAAQFQQAVCAQASVLLTCSGVYVDVHKFSSFSSVSRVYPVQNGVLKPNLVGYSTGGSGDIVLVQTFYQWPTIFGPLQFNLSNLSNGSRLLIATAVFRNEPYQ